MLQEPSNRSYLALVQGPFRKHKAILYWVSPSGCGLRFFVWGRIPDGTNSITGDGPQDDLSEDDKKEILKVKPDVQKKIDKGSLAFNHLKLYAQDRHLSVTGNRLDEYCFPEEDRSKL